MKVLDLYCGGGGAALGYIANGCSVVGIDHEPKLARIYPGEFHWARLPYGLDFEFARSFDFIHASPPCQLYSTLSHLNLELRYQALIQSTREILNQIDVPWVIENVPQAPVRRDLLLCGSMFGLHLNGHDYLKRHRVFEFWTDVGIRQPRCAHREYAIGVYARDGLYTTEEWQNVMRIPHLKKEWLAEAIPPAYTDFIWRGLTGVDSCARMSAST